MINQIYKSGSVIRWHSNPDIPIKQTNADHQGRVAQIVFFFWPNPPVDLLYAALHHDCGEMGIGDVASTAKSDPVLRDAISMAEAKNRISMGIDPFNTDLAKLQFIDRLEAYTYVRMNCPNLIVSDEWSNARFWLFARAEELGVSDQLAQWHSDFIHKPRQSPE